MFIDGIKVIPEGGSEARLWKFRNPQGAYKHLCVLACEADDAELIKQAIAYALFGTRAPKVKSVLVAMTDDNGDSWIFERSAENYRSLKNRQLLDVRNDAPQRDLFQDFLPFDTKTSFSWMELIRSFELSLSGIDLIAETGHEKAIRKSSWELAATERSLQSKNEIERAWGAGLEFTQIEKLPELGEIFLRKQASLEDQAKSLNKLFGGVSEVDTTLMRKLEQELEFIEQIRRISDPLMQAAKSPKNWHEKMHQVEIEKQKIEDAITQQAMPVPEDEVDWSYVLQVLSRSLACDRLEKTARASLTDAKDKLSPLVEAHKNSIQNFLRHDQDVIKTLETCLHELDALHHRSQDTSHKKNNLGGKLNKLLGFNPHEPLTLKAHVSAEDGIDDARALVNEVLNQIGILYTRFDNHKSAHDEKLSDFQSRYDQIAAEYTKSREQWMALAQSLGINPDTSVSQLILSINLYSQLSALRLKSSRLADEYSDYKNHIRTLVSLIEAWRSHTGSQKSLPLDHPSAVLSEARQVISYQDKKIAQLRKLRGIEAQIETYRLMKTRLQDDQERLDRKWKSLLTELSLPERALNSAVTASSFGAAREFLQFESLRVKTQSALKNEQIFAEAAFNAPLVFFGVFEANLSNKSRLRLLQAIEQSTPHGYGLILSTDSALVDMMQKMGLSHGSKIASKAAEPKAPAPVAAKPLISDKARSALEIFASKQTTTTR
ncbi:MAG: hypothetical protein V4655_02750 [Bdellovibrionota bacterium]|nr:MAG: hypothetical protein EOP10_06545 [Pseudomonadota bacterium]